MLTSDTEPDGWREGGRVVLVSGGSRRTSKDYFEGSPARPAYYCMRNQIWFSRGHGSFLGSVAISIYLL